MIPPTSPSLRRGLLVAAAAVLGLAAALGARWSGEDQYGAVRPGLAALPAPGRAADASLADAALAERLAALGREAGIGPAQQSAWQAFTDDMLRLSRLTAAYERRLAAGEAVDTAGEQATHALMFGAAITALDDRLPPEQAAVVRRAAGQLAGGLVCRGLAGG